VRTEHSHQELPSITKTEYLSSKDEESYDESEINSVDLKPHKNHRIRKNPRNETKNIPKNFGKAIISFI
jgi:hypothetical protein